MTWKTGSGPALLWMSPHPQSPRQPRAAAPPPPGCSRTRVKQHMGKAELPRASKPSDGAVSPRNTRRTPSSRERFSHSTAPAMEPPEGSDPQPLQEESSRQPFVILFGTECRKHCCGENKTKSAISMYPWLQVLQKASSSQQARDKPRDEYSPGP